MNLSLSDFKASVILTGMVAGRQAFVLLISVRNAVLRQSWTSAFQAWNAIVLVLTQLTHMDANPDVQYQWESGPPIRYPLGTF